MLFAAAKSSLAAFGISTGVNISVTEYFFHICHIHRFHEASFVDPLTGLVQSSRPSCGGGKHNHFTLHLSGDRAWQLIPQCCIVFIGGEMNECMRTSRGLGQNPISSPSVVIPPTTTPLSSLPSELFCSIFQMKDEIPILSN
jgi:hypothetical protein